VNSLVQTTAPVQQPQNLSQTMVQANQPTEVTDIEKPGKQDNSA